MTEDLYQAIGIVLMIIMVIAGLLKHEFTVLPVAFILFIWGGAISTRNKPWPSSPSNRPLWSYREGRRGTKHFLWGTWLVVLIITTVKYL